MHCELIDWMGSDSRVVDAARVSFNKSSENYTDEQNHKLIKYLNDHDHWSPFSHVMITMRETVPIFVARQRFKHMVGFTYNEVSRRYVDSPPEFYVPNVWRSKAENKKQGSGEGQINLKHYAIDYGTHEPEYIIQTREKWEEAFPDEPWGEITDQTEVDGSIENFINGYYRDVEILYENLINAGVAPEQARMVLPQSMYTSYYVTGSLVAWARAYKLRSNPDAQKEIQELAEQWDNIISGIDELDKSWEALKI